MAEPARRKTQPQEIADALRTQILRGVLTPGLRLPPERELALSLGTNRTTLREALRTLEAEGLVEARHGHGVRLRDFRRTGSLALLPEYFRVAEPADQLRLMADLMRLRRVVAREAVVLAAELAGPADLAALATCLTSLSERERAGTGTLMDPELALYRAVVEAGKSLAGMWLFNSIEAVIRQFGDTYPGLWLTPPRFAERWATIVEAIGDRAPRRAETLLTKLLADTDELVVAELEPARRPRRRP
jgi:GntR family transcriptional repressor for pyruvate dehydrogenase complex